MGKLFNTYKNLKMKNSEKIYLFQSGIFYIFLDDDAKLMSSILNLKLTNLSPEVVKCGFPVNSINKYINIFNNLNYDIEIVQNSNVPSVITPNNYIANQNILKFIEFVSSISPDTLSISEAYDLLNQLKQDSLNLLNKATWLKYFYFLAYEPCLFMHKHFLKILFAFCFYKFNYERNTMEKSNDNLKIYQKYLELIYYSNDIVRKYPKSENFTLVQEIKNSLYVGLRNLMYAIKTFNKKEKLNYLNEFDTNMNLLKIHIRISFKYKYISLQNYNTWVL